jgi:hypothetical protein
MNQIQKEFRLTSRSKQKKLRSVFRSAGEARKIGYAVDLSGFCEELAALPAPTDLRKASQFVKLQIFAAQYFYSRNELEPTKELLLSALNYCRQFKVFSLKLKVMRLLTKVLRQQKSLDDVQQYLDEAISTAKEMGRRRLVKDLQKEMGTICALIEYEASVHMGGVFALLDEDKDEHEKLEGFKLTRLDPAEAVGANRPRMKRTDFPSRIRPYSFGPSKGSKKAVFTTTLLIKRFGPWMRYLRKSTT